MPGSPKGRKQGNTSVETKAAVRRREVLQLKLAGATHRAIAERMGVSAPQITKDLQRILREMAEANREGADELRALMMERYNRLLLAAWPKAITGAGTGFDQAMRVLQAIRAINGLDPKEPIQIDARTQTVIMDGRDPREILDEKLALIAERTGTNGATQEPLPGRSD